MRVKIDEGGTSRSAHINDNKRVLLLFVEKHGIKRLATKVRICVETLDVFLHTDATSSRAQLVQTISFKEQGRLAKLISKLLNPTGTKKKRRNEYTRTTKRFDYAGREID